tara:strand:- start:1654 stop:1806 length:153 start_codon:yes stop_codon:yes gene_type:complete
MESGISEQDDNSLVVVAPANFSFPQCNLKQRLELGFVAIGTASDRKAIVS